MTQVRSHTAIDAAAIILLVHLLMDEVGRRDSFRESGLSSQPHAPLRIAVTPVPSSPRR